MSSTPELQARAVIELARAGRFDEIRRQFPAPLRLLVSAQTLQTAWEAELARHGALDTIGEPVLEPARGNVVVARVALEFEHGATTLVIAMRRGRLVGIRTVDGEATVVGEWEPPAYANPDAFVEHEHTIGSGPEAVSATLTLPCGEEPWPAAVLLAGSGPQDRDETIGPNKPLKDLAWGLASHGVAVARFDKITYSDPEHLAAKADRVTVMDEYAPQAIAALRLLANQPDVDRIVLIGHSLGATIAPRIATNQSDLAGLVLLAAGAQPLHWAIVRQLRHLATLTPGTASPQTVDIATAHARRVDSPQLSLTTPPSDLPFGVPAAYWLDLRAYDPVATAAKLRIPMLIIQGARDYQVTVDDDLALWQAGLTDRPEVTIHVDPDLDHLLARGTGPSTPAAYDQPQHIDGDIITNIAAWIHLLG